MSAAEELLAELGLAPGDTDSRALVNLVLRLEARVPHERVAAEARPPERVAAEHLQEGSGAAGAERTALLGLLAEGLGFLSRVVVGTRRAAAEELPHRALLFDLPEGPALADPAFPLPGLVPVGGIGLPSPWGRLDLERDGKSLVLTIDGRGIRERALTLSLGEADAAATLPLPAPGTLLKLFDDRVALWEAGLLTVLDPWSELVHPLADAGTLERLFGVTPAASPEREAPATLAVHDRSPLPMETLLARLQSPEGLLALAPAGWTATGTRERTGGWSWSLACEGSPAAAEDVLRLPRGLLVMARDEGRAFVERRYEAAETRGGTRLSLRAVLRAAPSRGLPESVRKTLVFHLASELLAWGREPDEAQ